MADIIDFNKRGEPEAEPMFTYVFTPNVEGREPVEVTGLFTFNPMFYGITDQDQRLIFAMPSDSVLSVYRKEGVPGGAPN